MGNLGSFFINRNRKTWFKRDVCIIILLRAIGHEKVLVSHSVSELKSLFRNILSLLESD